MTTPRESETLVERIDAAIERVANGHAPMRIPADQTDVDLVLSDCRAEIARLQAEVARLREKEVSDEVLAFLHGAGPLKGCWFGEKPVDERGNYWWRKHLPAAQDQP